MSCLSKISCFAARRVLSSMSTKPSGVFVLSNLAGRISNLVKYSTKYIPYGTPPAQTPSVESPEWEAMLENAKLCEEHPPIFLIDIKRNQKMYKMEKRIDQIEKKFKETMELIKDIMELIYESKEESNENLHKKFNHFIEALNEQH